MTAAALTVITPREASAFACLCDAMVAPGDALPPVAQTDAAFAYDRALATQPPVNRIALRAMVAILELLPLVLAGRRMRRLDPGRRAHVLAAIERNPAAEGMVKAVRGVAHLSYYGDDAVMRRLGYDPDVIVARAARLRAEESRW